MSRIDEALRRAAGGTTRATTPVIPAEEVFTSPWSHSQAAETKSAAPLIAKAGSSVLSETVKTTALRFSPVWFDLLTVSPNVDTRLAEQFRRLAGNLHNAQTAGRLKVILMTSAGPGDGKTMTAMNLALVLSESYGRRVLLVDADLRRPSLHQICGYRSIAGLSEGLRAPSQQKLTVIQLTSTLSLLPGGRPDPDPMDALTSDRMRDILAEASERFDWVIIDTPPVGLVPDASLLATMADTILFVVRASQSRLGLVSKSIDSIGRDRIFGVVLNGAAESERTEYPTYYMSQNELHDEP